MEAKSKLKKYVGSAGWAKVCAWIFGAAAVVCLLMCTAFGKKTDDSEAVKYDPLSTEEGTYAYVDILGVSNCLWEKDSVHFYSAEDEYDNLYMVELPSSVIKKLDEHEDYWMRDEPGYSNVSKPEAYRVYGVVCKDTAEQLSDFAYSWDVSQIIFATNFGRTYLNVGSSPSDSWNIPWILGTIFAGLFFVIFMIISARANNNMKKCFARLEQAGMLEQAAQELDAPGYVGISGDNGRVSENFLFGKHTGTVLLNKDIVWCFTRVNTSGQGLVGGYFVANTVGRKNIDAINLGVVGFAEEGNAAEEAIAKSNPYVLRGQSKENSAAYKRICKENR